MHDWDRPVNNVDFMRLSRAVLVLCSHGYALGLGSEVREPLELLRMLIAEAGLIDCHHASDLRLPIELPNQPCPASISQSRT